MSDHSPATRTIHLPVDLLARMEELKQDREMDRNRSVEDIILVFCQEYITVREMARHELAHMDEINRSYEERPDDWENIHLREKTHGETGGAPFPRLR